MDLSNLTEEALKALAYDEIRRMQISQNNLRVIETELSKRETNKVEIEAVKNE